MKKIKIIVVLSLIIFLLFSCRAKKVRVKSTEFYYSNGHQFAFNIDSTYYESATGGYGNGSWVRRNDTVILNSEYNIDTIQGVSVLNSVNDSSKYSILQVLFISGREPWYASIHLKNNLRDTIVEYIYPFYPRIIKDSICHFSIQLRGNGFVPTSRKSQFKNTDTVTFIIDYPDHINNYFYRSNEVFRIDDENHLLIPVKKATD